MDPVVHFELPAEDRERMAAFYTKAFGWEAEMFGPEMRNYTLVTTTETRDGRPTLVGRDQRRAVLANRRSSVPRAVGGDRGAGHRGVASRSAGSRWQSHRAGGDSRGRALCELPRHRGQPGEHAAAASARLTPASLIRRSSRQIRCTSMYGSGESTAPLSGRRSIPPRSRLAP